MDRFVRSTRLFDFWANHQEIKEADLETEAYIYEHPDDELAVSDYGRWRNGPYLIRFSVVLQNSLNDLYINGNEYDQGEGDSNKDIIKGLIDDLLDVISYIQYEVSAIDHLHVDNTIQDNFLLTLNNAIHKNDGLIDDNSYLDFLNEENFDLYINTLKMLLLDLKGTIQQQGGAKIIMSGGAKRKRKTPRRKSVRKSKSPRRKSVRRSRSPRR